MHSSVFFWKILVKVVLPQYLGLLLLVFWLLMNFFFLKDTKSFAMSIITFATARQSHRFIHLCNHKIFFFGRQLLFLKVTRKKEIMSMTMEMEDSRHPAL